MHDRHALGPADVDDAQLAAMVADSLGVAEVELLSSRADVVAYDIDAITTAGRSAGGGLLVAGQRRGGTFEPPGSAPPRRGWLDSCSSRNRSRRTT